MAQKKITDLQLRGNVSGDLNFPSDDTIQSYRVTGSQIFDYIRGRIPPESNEISNVGLATSVATSALTIALKTKAGTNPSTTDVVRVAFRNVTLLTGDYSIVEITSAQSLVISSGSTLGQVDGQASRIWVYLLSTGELAVSGKLFPENALVTTTAEGGAGGADSRTVMYSTTARTDVAVRLIGYIDNTQTTAGTWASAGTQIQLLNKQVPKLPTLQKFTSGSGTYITPPGVAYIRVRLVGGGGGGAGGGSATPGAGGTGGTSSFGTSLLEGVGGAGGTWGSGGNAGVGGTASLGTGPVGIAVSGSAGVSTDGNNVANTGGGTGGTSPFGGAGKASTAGITNTGSGGGGGSTAGSGSSGGGGGSGGFVDAIIVSPLASYAYAVGAAGSAGTAGGGSGGAGGAGGSGVIIVEEYYL